MTPAAHRHINTRAALAVVMLIVVLVIGLRIKHAEQSATTSPVFATVVATAPSAGEAGASTALPLVVLELADGSRVRLQPGSAPWAVGERVTLLQTTLADGSRRYRWQTPSP